MKPYYERDGITLYHGDALETLRALPDGAAQMCVTSPPYWGLRDYGTATWDGGDAECKHGIGEREPGDRRASTLGGGVATIAAQDSGVRAARETCGKCGAKRIDRQLGLEPTPEEYVANMVDVFREVRRVLRDDGTLWLNIGDSYNAYNGNRGTESRYAGNRTAMEPAFPSGGLMTPELKPKDLVGIPWRLAFALQADGWYFRSDIIWAKPNPMPESVTDRPTKAHEYLFLMAKRATYYYDQNAILERAETILKDQPGTVKWMTGRGNSKREQDGTRNKRTVWTIATEPYPEAHFATFPTALVTPCILAGSPEGGVVLDPFAGSGTTLQVAKQLGRKGIGIELNADYLPLIEDRLNRIPIPMPIFSEPPAEKPQQLMWQGPAGAEWMHTVGAGNLEDVAE